MPNYVGILLVACLHFENERNVASAQARLDKFEKTLTQREERLPDSSEAQLILEAHRRYGASIGDAALLLSE